jgi:hypothetical protein
LYLLMDLERTIGTNIPVYWKPNKRGYTKILEQAGLYTSKEASAIVESDFDNTTVKIHKDIFIKILGEDFKNNEGTT